MHLYLIKLSIFIFSLAFGGTRPVRHTYALTVLYDEGNKENTDQYITRHGIHPRLTLGDCRLLGLRLCKVFFKLISVDIYQYLGHRLVGRRHSIIPYTQSVVHWLFSKGVNLKIPAAKEQSTGRKRSPFPNTW